LYLKKVVDLPPGIYDAVVKLADFCRKQETCETCPLVTVVKKPGEETYVLPRHCLFNKDTAEDWTDTLLQRGRSTTPILYDSKSEL
jgi:hypothetical protein